jgi:hypothetical protein
MAKLFSVDQTSGSRGSAFSLMNHDVNNFWAIGRIQESSPNNKYLNFHHAKIDKVSGSLSNLIYLETSSSMRTIDL